MEFTVVDAGVAVVTLLSGILAYSRGFTRELFAIAGWIAAAVAAFYAAPMLEPLIRELPVVGKFLAASCVISMIAAFTVIVALTLMILSMFTPMIAGLVLESALGPLDRMLGFVFGVARGLVLIAIVFLIYTHYSGADAWPPLDTAASKTIFEESAALIEQNLPPSIFDWLGERMEALMVNCGDEVPGAGAPAATDLPAPEPGTVPQGGATTGTDSTGTGTTGTGTAPTGN
jgi:membrane protein required for colicin V production